MNKPIITVKVARSMKQEQWFDIYADGWLIGTIWGTAEVTYNRDPKLREYRLSINNTGSFIYADIIKRRVEAVEPIISELVRL